MRRRLQATLGAALIAVGLLGLLTLRPATAVASGRAPGDRHAAMHRMMDRMHGPGTAASMHRIRGAERMMDDCARTMGSGGGMMGMMSGDMMSGR